MSNYTKNSKQNWGKSSRLALIVEVFHDDYKS